MTSTEAARRGPVRSAGSVGAGGGSRPRSSSALRNSSLTAVPLPGAAFDPRRAARLARHAIDHRQAEAGALADLLGGEEGLERALGDLGRHSDAGVG